MSEWTKEQLLEQYPILQEISAEKEIVWINPDHTTFAKGMEQMELTMADVEDAERRLERFAPFIVKCFPETEALNGIIESPLKPISQMQA